MTVPAVAAKVAVVAAAVTVTLAGTVRLALLLIKATVAPPEGAAPLKVTVQVLEPGPVREAGLQARPLKVTVTGATSDIAELALPPLAVAVRVAVALAETVPAVATKEPEVAAAAMLSEAGAVSNALLLEIATVRPPAGAAALSVTVQVLVAREARELGEQLSAPTFTSGDRVMEAVFEVPFNVAVTTGV